MEPPSMVTLREQAVARPLPQPPSTQNTPAAMESAGRRESDVALPPWQPDSDVTHCPVCGSQFTLFYRKHHCRRCGRVVCSACSPHRITIPHQFIVRPPSEAMGTIPGLVRIETDSSVVSRNPALGGGHEVRVCNPCVPDPNFSPPPQYRERDDSDGRYTLPPEQGLAPYRYQSAPHPRDEPFHRLPYIAPERYPLRRRETRPPDIYHTEHMRYLTSRYAPLNREPTSQLQARQATQQPAQLQQELRHPSVPTPSSPLLPPLSSTPGVRQSMQHVPRQTNPWYAHPPPAGTHPIYGFYDSSESVSDAMRLMDNRMRRQSRMTGVPLAEDDTCPACGKELPPKAPDGDTSAREQHVRDCIDAIFTPALPRSNSLSGGSAPERSPSREGPTALSHSHQDADNGEGSATATVLNRFSLSRPSMFEYTASEKDCLDGDESGKPAECIICFEEFAAGDEMGRLVCWCRFHRGCIKDWWERKGPGACPTHQLGY
ncbi:FYVE-domain-containing protein [Lindgomyces ingoldianus]|uniref:FYVE-domain-containing protein n=1 Tax=Lindgomyces ingoldianus TaxID=673940 RepID=A0ACB6QSG7_9PLEO|nr:FYVE-domain-containing protein [Lindgomyces ingoldianus]KAF2469116.1 FYVE-domain-containing protein [Lindgomyces ingoldianus]